MSEYAKVFESEKFGQLVVMNSSDDDGNPAVVVFFKHPELHPSQWEMFA